MMWPLSFCAPGSVVPPEPDGVLDQLEEYDNIVQIRTVQARVVAVRSFSESAVEPVVRKTDEELREYLRKDDLVFSSTVPLQFAQFDAVYSMGTRRGEVWIELSRHPWSTE